MDSISKDAARRIALVAQGFGVPRPKEAGPDDMKQTIDRLRLIQIDSVNVLVRAHYMPFFARLGPYRREMLDELAYRDRYLFEQWAHVASFVPMADYGLLQHQMAEGHHWRKRSVSEERLAYFETILDRVRTSGPIVTGEMEGEGDSGTKGWWGWSDAKVGLEYQFAFGRLAVKERRNFARVYEIAERVFPAETFASALSKEEAQRQMVRNSLRAMGVATKKDLADYYRLKVGDVSPRIAELVDCGEARAVEVEGWKEAGYLDARIEDAPDVRPSAILNPFDNLIWDRARTERIFDFFYRIEIYTPAAKRVHGYYVLPFMHDGRLVARVDLKANRAESTLLVQAAHLEPGAPAAKTGSALAKEVKLMARWLGLERIVVGERGDLSGRLASVLKG
ncbi:MAG: crosslink repair DNA glycosylase YcaQ family protein [Tepidiformaceae bacterium]